MIAMLDDAIVVADRHRLTGIAENEPGELPIGNDLLVTLLLREVGHNHADGRGSELGTTAGGNEDRDLVTIAPGKSEFAASTGVIAGFAEDGVKLAPFGFGNEAEDGRSDNGCQWARQQIGCRFVGKQDGSRGTYGDCCLVHRLDENAVSVLGASESEHLLVSRAGDDNGVHRSSADRGQSVFALLQARAKLAQFLRQAGHLQGARINVISFWYCHMP